MGIECEREPAFAYRAWRLRLVLMLARVLVHLLVFRPLRAAPALGRVVASVGVTITLQALVVLRFGTGAGITWGSEAVQEWEETELKAARLVALATGAAQESGRV